MKYLIELVADTEGINPAVTALEKIKKADEANALQFKKTNEKYAEMAKQGNANMDKLFKGLTNVSKAAAGDLGKKALTDASKATESFRSQLRQSREEMTKLFVSGKATSSEIYNAARAGGELKDSIGDASQAISVLSSDTFKLDSAIQGLQVGASVFQGLQGASALFGDENKDVLKTIAKLNGIMAVTQSLQQITNALQAQSAFRLGVTVAAQKLYTFAIGESTGALRIFKLALASTGIGLLVIGLIALITNFKKVTEYIGISSAKLEKFGDVLSGLKEGALEFFNQVGVLFKDLFSGDFSKLYQDAKQIGKNVGQAFENGVKESKIEKILQKRIDDETFVEKLLGITGDDNAALQIKIKKTTDIALLALKKFNKDKSKENKEAYLDAVLDQISAQEELDKFNADAEKERLSKLKEKRDLQKELFKKRLEDELAVLQISEIQNKNHAKALLNIEVLMVKKRAEIAKADEESAVKRRLIDIQTIEAINKLHDDYYVKELERINKNLESFKDAESKKREEYNKTNEELQKALEEREKLNKENLDKLNAFKDKENEDKQKDYEHELQLEKEKQDIIKETIIQGANEISAFIFQMENDRIQSNLNKQLSALAIQKNAELANKELTEAQKDRINKRYAAEELKARKKAFEETKKAKLAEALINGSLAVTALLVKYLPPSPLFFAGLATIALNTALSVATISAQKFAKGTEYVNGKGTETSDSVPAMLSKGERVVDASTNKRLKGIPNKLLPLLVNQNFLPSQTLISQGMDYDKMAKVFAKEMSKQPVNNFIFDANGFTKSVERGNTSTQIKNSKNGF